MNDRTNRDKDAISVIVIRVIVVRVIVIDSAHKQNGSQIPDVQSSTESKDDEAKQQSPPQSASEDIDVYREMLEKCDGGAGS